MYIFAHLLTVVTAFTLGALAQYDDGYETVTTSTTPVQIRLAYAGPTAMMVSWNTFSQLPNPTVNYGTSPGALTQTASSSVSVTYATSLTYNNHVNITGLQPFTTYYYLPQYSNATTPYSFTTSRVAGDITPYTVGVVVDMGTFGVLGLSNTTGPNGGTSPLAMNEQTTISSITQQLNSFEFMVHAGDIAYADYWLKEEIEGYIPTTSTAQGAQVYESILNAFYDEMLGITSVKAYMVAAGNHEANCDNGGTTNKTSGQKYTESICMPGQTNFTGYQNHWRMPSGPSGGQGNFWYSYDYGLAHFVHIDTETDLGSGLVGPDEGSPEYGGPFGSYNQQINWLISDLANVNRTLTPWIILFGHRGWYLSGSSSVCSNCQTAFEKILWTYGVDLYINGHAHFYERTTPIYNGNIDPNGLNNPNSTLYITTGAAGHYDGLDSFTTIQPYSVARANGDYSWTTISITDAQHLTVNTMWSANNTVFDSATLYRAHVYNSTAITNTSSSVSIATTGPSSTIASSSSSSSLSLTSTISGTSSVSSNPTATTNTATGTSSSVYPAYTNFNGKGALYVYVGGVLEGDIGSAGTWYNTPGQNTATYTAVPLYPNNTGFYLEHSPNYCMIGSDYSFSCSLTSTSGATIFGQTPDGNLTYNGQDGFYASSSASSGSKPTVYATSLPVSLNIVWGGSATTTTTSSIPNSSGTSTPSTSISMITSTPSSASSGSLSQSSSTYPIQTISSGPSSSSGSTSNSSPSATAIFSSSSSSLSTPPASSIVVTVTYVMTQPGSTLTYVTTQSGSLTTLTSTSISEVTVIELSTTALTETASYTSTQTATSTEIDTITQTDFSTETDIYTTTSTAISTETDISTATQSYTTTATIIQTSTEIGYITQTAVSTQTDVETSTEVDSTTVRQTVTMTEDDIQTTIQTLYQTSIIIDTVTVTRLATETDVSTEVDTLMATQTDIATDYTTVIESYTETDMTTFTQPASTFTTTQQASTVTYTQPASTVYTTQPASTITQTQSGSATTVTKAGSTITKTQTGSLTTVTYTRLPSTSTVRTTLPASTVTSRVTLPASTTTMRTTLPASTVTVTHPPSYITTTKSVTVTTTKTVRF